MFATRWMGLAVVIVCAGCGKPADITTQTIPASSSSSSASTTAEVVDAAEPIDGLPLTMTVEQRSTTPIPGSDGKWSLTIDDITRDQVVVSILDADNEAIAGPISLTAGRVVPFRAGEATCLLRLEKLSNALVGSDFATFVVDVRGAGETSETAGTLTEPQKIDRLIEIVAAQQNARFIRNGNAYTPAEAAEHLRTKLTAAGERIQTAEDFIEQVASGSSLSGQEYQIRMGDGRTVTSREFLLQELEKLKAR
jgi:hypothetical protein